MMNALTQNSQRSQNTLYTIQLGHILKNDQLSYMNRVFVLTLNLNTDRQQTNKHGRPGLDLNKDTVLLGSCDMVKEMLAVNSRTNKTIS